MNTPEKTVIIKTDKEGHITLDQFLPSGTKLKYNNSELVIDKLVSYIGPQYTYRLNNSTWLTLPEMLGDKVYILAH